ncbi:unnamed protein product, partial [Prorocentrum cordatum]
ATVPAAPSRASPGPRRIPNSVERLGIGMLLAQSRQEREEGEEEGEEGDGGGSARGETGADELGKCSKLARAWPHKSTPEVQQTNTIFKHLLPTYSPGRPLTQMRCLGTFGTLG